MLNAVMRFRRAEGAESVFCSQSENVNKSTQHPHGHGLIYSSCVCGPTDCEGKD